MSGCAFAGSALSLAITLAVMPLGVAQARRPAPKSAAHATDSNLVVSCDLVCNWTLDDDDKGKIDAQGTAKVRVAPGQHIVSAATEDGQDEICKEIDVAAGAPTQVQFHLLKARIARLDKDLQHQEQIIRDFKAAGDNASPPESPSPTESALPAGPPLPSQKPKEVPVELSPERGQSMLLENPTPPYPSVARDAGISGTVVLNATIAKDGTISFLNVVDGPPLLRQAALDTVKTWRYKPYLVNGQPVEALTTINVIFKLTEK
jgi:TonB family protein